MDMTTPMRGGISCARDVYKRQVLTPAEMEEIRTKDFFDMILPGTVKFLSDHYILGDSYRCVWAVREYPPSTEEQAILAQLADRSGVTLRIYHRLVEAQEQRKIIQNATRRNKLKSGGTDVNETIEEMCIRDSLKIVADASGEIKLLNSLDFSEDSLFCEWAYVIDFDKDTFEVYQGFNETPLEESERFYRAGQADDNGMYPVKIVESFDLSNLPSMNEFLEKCEPDEEETMETTISKIGGLTGI